MKHDSNPGQITRSVKRGFNAYRIDGEVAYLELTDLSGQAVAEAKVDASELPRLIAAGKRWCRGKERDGKFYVQRTGGFYLHRFLMGEPALQVDHINGDRLDNRLSNLRTCTPSENLQNRPAQSNNTSGFKGVDFQKRRHTWRAAICVGGKSHHLGEFKTPEAAARAYDAAAIDLHGSFAVLNFPLNTEVSA